MSTLIVPTRPIELPASLFFPRKDDWKRFSAAVYGEDYKKNWLFMAGSKTNYLSGKFANYAFGSVAWTTAANVYGGLWTSTLSDTSTGSTANEAAYTSYARAQIGTANNQTDAWNAGTGSTTVTITNKNQVSWPASTGGTSVCTYLGVLDASTTGNMLVWTDISSVTINSGDTPRLAASALSIVDD